MNFALPIPLIAMILPARVILSPSSLCGSEDSDSCSIKLLTDVNMSDVREYLAG